MYYVYALISVKHDRIYIGMTRNVNRRLKEHNAGKTKSIRYYRPWELFYTEEYVSRKEARKQEIKLKTTYGRKMLREKIDLRPCSSAG